MEIEIGGGVSLVGLLSETHWCNSHTTFRDEKGSNEQGNVYSLPLMASILGNFRLTFRLRVHVRFDRSF